MSWTVINLGTTDGITQDNWTELGTLTPVHDVNNFWAVRITGTGYDIGVHAPIRLEALPIVSGVDINQIDAAWGFGEGEPYPWQLPYMRFFPPAVEQVKVRARLRHMWPGTLSGLTLYHSHGDNSP